MKKQRYDKSDGNRRSVRDHNRFQTQKRQERHAEKHADIFKSIFGRKLT